jgi:hypothetical protein
MWHLQQMLRSQRPPGPIVTCEAHTIRLLIHSASAAARARTLLAREEGGEITG